MLSVSSNSVLEQEAKVRRRYFEEDWGVWNSTLQRKWRRAGKDLIRKPWRLPVVAMNLAAIQIQKVLRGCLAKRRIRQKKPVRRQAASWRKQSVKKQREEFDLFVMYHVAALEIQECFRRYYQQKAIRMIESMQPMSLHLAAFKVQRLWRSWTDKQQFRSRLQLLKFRNRGNPALLLKCINPKEAALFDKAAQITVRFRFGGTAFPPDIYYKVFTHGPLCDVGSFAPRDYTRVKQQDALQINTRQQSQQEEYQNRFLSLCSNSIRVGSSSFSARMSSVVSSSSSQTTRDASLGWYQRWENNGWRRVAAKTLREADEDPVTKRTKELAVRFHYSKVRRKEDQTVQRKQKRREWLRRIYGKEGKEGEYRGIDDDREEKFDEDESKHSEQKMRDEEGKETQVEDEEDALLEWCAELDFDNYLKEWKEIGTSF